MPKPRYQDDPDWEDVIPLPQDDGGQNALAVISYTEEYSEAISYLRAIMADNEHSERVLRLTAHIIDLNPAHYTVWYVKKMTDWGPRARTKPSQGSTAPRPCKSFPRICMPKWSGSML